MRAVKALDRIETGKLLRAVAWSFVLLRLTVAVSEIG
jgi:hypothetical protein